MNKTKNNVLVALASVFLALLLFVTANVNNSNKTGTQISGMTETYTNTLKNVPIDLKYDTGKYFVSGYANEAQVYLTAVNRVKLDSEINADTRKFKVVADLTNITSGTQSVPLTVENLPAGLTATVQPANIQVTIGKKKTKSFKVEAKINASQIAEGYELSSVTTDDETVSVTSDEGLLGQIDHVVATLPDDEQLSSSYSGSVTLQAVSKDGTILASIITPAKTTLRVTVHQKTK